MGEPTITLNIGENYTDAGATANDNKDGDISTKIITTGRVDTAKVGVYKIKYAVVDKAGNQATEVVRTVTVVEALDTIKSQFALCRKNNSGYHRIVAQLHLPT